MIINNRIHGYSSNRKYVQGAGFTDTIKSIGSYISQNKDLLAKPLLSAVGNLGALGIEKGIPEIISYIKNKAQQNKYVKAIDTYSSGFNDNKLTPEEMKITNNMLNNSQAQSSPSLNNIIGSREIKNF